MNEIEKLRVLIPHWVEHNNEHAQEFRDWAEHIYCLHWKSWAVRYPMGMVKKMPGKAT